MAKVINLMTYGAVILSLFGVDYLLGHGFLDINRKFFCKVMCFLKKTVKEESKNVHAPVDAPISFTMLVLEMLLLGLAIVFLNKYKQIRRKDRIDELLNESKDALRQTNEFLEKWRLRRINWPVTNEYSYLDDEPQEIVPLKLEVPILHMAIIDTLGTTRNKPDRGDAGDIVNVMNSTLLSVTSLHDDETSSVTESDEKINEEVKNIEFTNRYLWDVMEEDVDDVKNFLED